ncbi:MAG: aminoacyl-tRNA hydrolase [Flavobacteriales bacterium]|nr:aminoacyl-tRNA hydrolase [Flavobacteriales bacterium]
MRISEKIDKQLFNTELQFQFVRSGGPGGQHVNKVNSKVMLKFDIPNSQLLDELEKELLLQKLSNKLDSAGSLSIQTQEKRSQLQNKALAITKFYDILKTAFHRKKRRVATRPGKASIEKRLKEKKARAQKKENRRGGEF